MCIEPWIYLPLQLTLRLETGDRASMCHVALSLATREIQSLVRGCPHPGSQLGTSVCCFRDECALCPATRGKHGCLPWATVNSHTTIQTLDPAAVQGLAAEDTGRHGSSSGNCST